MDTLTHIALGAVIGEAYAGKKLGKRAMVIGALAQSLPDIDFVASFWLPAADNLIVHRGITHSILFSLIATVLLALAAYRWHKTPTLSPSHWAVFFGIEIFVHLFLDAFNNYGVGWFEPFSHYRISFNTLFVADPFYSLWIGVAFLVLLLLKSNSKKRKTWTRFGLVMSSLYLVYALFNKVIINTAVEKNLMQQNLVHTRFFTTPTALNNWLWYIVAEDASGYYIGYRSVFDRKDSIGFRHFKRQEKLLDPIKKQDDLQQLLRFAQGYYTVETWGDTLVFNDLRFGQIMGWNHDQAPFVFHYYLQHPTRNLLVIQRGRFTGWDRKNLKSLVKRIQGN